MSESVGLPLPRIEHISAHGPRIEHNRSTLSDTWKFASLAIPQAFNYQKHLFPATILYA